MITYETLIELGCNTKLATDLCKPNYINPESLQQYIDLLEKYPNWNLLREVSFPGLATILCNMEAHPQLHNLDLSELQLSDFGKLRGVSHNNFTAEFLMKHLDDTHTLEKWGMVSLENYYDLNEQFINEHFNDMATVKRHHVKHFIDWSKMGVPYEINIQWFHIIAYHPGHSEVINFTEDDFKLFEAIINRYKISLHHNSGVLPLHQFCTIYKLETREAILENWEKLSKCDTQLYAELKRRGFSTQDICSLEKINYVQAMAKFYPQKAVPVDFLRNIHIPQLHTSDYVALYEVYGDTVVQELSSSGVTNIALDSLEYITLRPLIPSMYLLLGSELWNYYNLALSVEELQKLFIQLVNIHYQETVERLENANYLLTHTTEYSLLMTQLSSLKLDDFKQVEF